MRQSSSDSSPDSSSKKAKNMMAGAVNLDELEEDSLSSD